MHDCAEPTAECRAVIRDCRAPIVGWAALNVACAEPIDD